MKTEGKQRGAEMKKVQKQKRRFKKDKEKKVLCGRGIAAAFVLILLAGVFSTAVFALAGDEFFQVEKSALREKTTVFSDLGKTHWAFDEIAQMAESGVLSGYPDETFRPDSVVTYGEFLKMIYLIGNKAAAFSNSGYGKHWADDYYYAAQAAGYFNENRIEIGFLDLPIPREHTAHVACGMLRSFKSLENCLMQESLAGDEKNKEEFSDVKAGGVYAYDILTVCRAGIFRGYPDGSFGPQRFLTRAEAVVAAGRLAQYRKILEDERSVSFENLENLSIDEVQSSYLKETSSTPPDGRSRGKETGEKFIYKVEKPDRVIPVVYDVLEVSRGDMGILNVEFVSENTIKIYSSIKHPFVKLMGRDGKLLKSIAFPEGSWYEEDGMYIYAANPQGTELQNTIPYLLLDDESNKIYRYGDITI